MPTESSAKRLRHPMPNDMLNNNWKEAGENTVAQQEADISDARSAPISDLSTMKQNARAKNKRINCLVKVGIAKLCREYDVDLNALDKHSQTRVAYFLIDPMQEPILQGNSRLRGP